MTTPELYTYTDPSDDTLTIGRTRNVVSLLAHQGNDTTEIHVLPADVEQVVAAIRTAAGQDQPGESCGREQPHPTHKFMRGRVLHQCQGVAASPDGQDQPHDRRARYAAAIQLKVVPRIALTSILPEVYEATDAAMAVADTEQQDHVAATKYWFDAADEWREEIVRLRAELAQARSAVLSEAADRAEQLMDERYGPDCSYGIGGQDVARELRLMATEAQQAGRPQPEDEEQPA